MELYIRRHQSCETRWHQFLPFFASRRQGIRDARDCSRGEYVEVTRWNYR